MHYWAVIVDHTYVLRVILFALYSFLTLEAFAQNPSANFSIPNEACIDENIIIQNTSNGGISYEWDLCINNLLENPSIYQLGGISATSFPMGLSMVYDTPNWFCFISDFYTGKLYRLKLNHSLDTVLNVTEVNNLSGKLDASCTNAFHKENGNWYGLVTDRVNNSLVRLKFLNGVNNDPVVDNLGNLGGWAGLRGVDITSSDSQTVVLASSFDNDKVTVLDFGDSLTNIPATIDINTSTISGPLGTAIVKESNSWYGFIVSFKNGKIVRLNFGSNLVSNPSVEVIAEVSKPADIKLVKEGTIYQAFIITIEGAIIRLDFENGLSASPSVVNLGNLGLLNNTHGVELAYSNGSWAGYTIDGQSKNLSKFAFPDNCSYVSTPFTKEESPIINYSQAAKYGIKQTVYDEFGNQDDTIQIISVLQNTAPSVDIGIEGNCLNDSINFSGLNIENSEITSWHWSFGDGTTAIGHKVSHQYKAPGTYTITLEVESANGCGNRISRDITIFEPPDPAFAIPEGLLCSNGSIAFTNLTNTQGADDIITYSWNFNGEGTSTEANPSFTFTTGGAKTVSLTASIPGCSVSYDTTFMVIQGPQVSFAAASVCQGESVTFENLTVGENITRYYWQFGDGGTFTSTTAEHPSYVYDTAGAFTVMLTVTNTSGCANTFSKTVQVYDRPAVHFLAELACAGTPVYFTDQTTAGATANIIHWEWDFGDGSSISHVRHPEHTYARAGTYLVRLIAYSSAGCGDSLVQEIAVESPVTADFAYQTLCSSEGNGAYTVQLNDLSTVSTGNRINQWLWSIEGETFTQQHITYTFDAPGNYNVTLTATAASACSESITKTVAVIAEPEVAFQYTAACLGENLVFSNETSDPGGYISSYTWDFGGLGSSFETNPRFVFPEAGDHMVKLTAITADGCSYVAQQNVHVPTQVEARFTPSAVYGAYPLTIQLDNQSAGASSYQWVIGSDSLQEESPAYTFTVPGKYKAELTATNALGCVDTYSQLITVVEPQWDLVLESMRVLPAAEAHSYQVVLTMSNQGTVMAEKFPVSIRVGQLLELQEVFTGQIAPGEVVSYPVSFTVSAQLNQQLSVAYICAILPDAAGELTDSRISNNRACASLSPGFISIPPYPNPVTDFLEIALILPQTGDVRVSLENLEGKKIRSYHFGETKPGLNSFVLYMEGITQGAYILQIYYLQEMKTYRVAVRP